MSEPDLCAQCGAPLTNSDATPFCAVHRDGWLKSLERSVCDMSDDIHYGAAIKVYIANINNQPYLIEQRAKEMADEQADEE